MRNYLKNFRWRLMLPDLKLIRKVIVAVVGGTVLLIGACMVVLPGPAIIVIPLGLAILATEFVWARRWLRRAKQMWPKRGKPAAGTEESKPADASRESELEPVQGPERKD
jgi:hypothetical protein